MASDEKQRVCEKQPSNISEEVDAITKTWVAMDREYFVKLAHSVPSRIKKVLQVKGNMTKY